MKLSEEEQEAYQQQYQIYQKFQGEEEEISEEELKKILQNFEPKSPEQLEKMTE